MTKWLTIKRLRVRLWLLDRIRSACWKRMCGSTQNAALYEAHYHNVTETRFEIAEKLEALQ